jgi:hypothetical protein
MHTQAAYSPFPANALPWVGNKPALELVCGWWGLLWVALTSACCTFPKIERPSHFASYFEFSLTTAALQQARQPLSPWAERGCRGSPASPDLQALRATVDQWLTGARRTMEQSEAYCGGSAGRGLMSAAGAALQQDGLSRPENGGLFVGQPAAQVQGYQAAEHAASIGTTAANRAPSGAGNRRTSFEPPGAAASARTATGWLGGCSPRLAGPMRRRVTRMLAATPPLPPSS